MGLGSLVAGIFKRSVPLPKLLATAALLAGGDLAAPDQKQASTPDPQAAATVTCPAGLKATVQQGEIESELNRYTLLHGETRITPSVVTEECDDATRYKLVEVSLAIPTFVDEGFPRTATRNKAPFSFNLDFGNSLVGRRPTLEAKLLSEDGTVLTLAYQTNTLDIPDRGAGAMVGSSVEARTSAGVIPKDMLKLQVAVTDENGEYLLDKGPEDFSIRVDRKKVPITRKLAVGEDGVSISVAGPNGAEPQYNLQFFPPNLPTEQLPPIRMLLLMDVSSMLERTEGGDSYAWELGYDNFIDKALIGGVKELNAYVQAGPFPDVELIFLRHAATPQLHPRRLKLGGSIEEQLQEVRAFYLQEPHNKWRPDQSRLQYSLSWLRDLANLSTGKAGIFIISSGDHQESRGARTRHPFKNLEDEAEKLERFSRIATLIEQDNPYALEAAFQHLTRNQAALYGMVIPEIGTRYSKFDADITYHGGRTFVLDDPVFPRSVIQGPDPISFGSGLILTLDDMNSAYLIGVDAENRTQSPRQRNISVNVQGGRARSTREYAQSPSRRDLIPIYLTTTRDPTYRLVGAAAARNYPSLDMMETLSNKLHAPTAENQETRAEAFRSYAIIGLDLVVNGKRREATRAYEHLQQFELPLTLLHLQPNYDALMEKTGELHNQNVAK